MSYKQQAYARGEDAAKAAASWVIDGNTSQEHIRRMVKWFDEGDPRRYDYLPARPNLSGEWSDDLTPNGLADELGMMNEERLPHYIDEISEAFEEGVADFFEPECERILKAAMTEDE